MTKDNEGSASYTLNNPSARVLLRLHKNLKRFKTECSRVGMETCMLSKISPFQ